MKLKDIVRFNTDKANIMNATAPVTVTPNRRIYESDIVAMITANPGISLHTLKRKLGNGSRSLEADISHRLSYAARKVKPTIKRSRQDGAFRYYPLSYKLTEDVVKIVEPVVRRSYKTKRRSEHSIVVEFIRNNPGRFSGEIARELHLRSDSISATLSKVTAAEDGIEREYYKGTYRYAAIGQMPPLNTEVQPKKIVAMATNDERIKQLYPTGQPIYLPQSMPLLTLSIEALAKDFYWETGSKDLTEFVAWYNAKETK